MIILLQLVEGERKAVYEDCENEKNDNREKVKKMKEEIRELQGRLRDSTASSEPVLKHVQGRRYLQLNVLKKKSGEDAVEASVISENDFTGIWSAGLFPLFVILCATGAIVCFSFSLVFPPDSLKCCS